jgi:hypothetical protein
LWSENWKEKMEIFMLVSNIEKSLDIMGCIPVLGTAVGVVEYLYFLAKKTHCVFQAFFISIKLKEFHESFNDYESRLKNWNDKQTELQETKEIYENMLMNARHVLSENIKQLQSNDGTIEEKIAKEEIAEERYHEIEKLNPVLEKMAETIRTEEDKLKNEIKNFDEDEKLKTILKYSDQYKSKIRDIKQYNNNSNRGLLRATWVGGIGIALYGWEVLDLYL